MEWFSYLLIFFGVAAIFFVVASFVLMWSVKRGHFQHFDKQEKSVFTEVEPEGVVIDRFPARR